MSYVPPGEQAPGNEINPGNNINIYALANASELASALEIAHPKLSERMELLFRPGYSTNLLTYNGQKYVAIIEEDIPGVPSESIKSYLDRSTVMDHVDLWGTAHQISAAMRERVDDVSVLMGTRISTDGPSITPDQRLYSINSSAESGVVTTFDLASRAHTFGLPFEDCVAEGLDYEQLSSTVAGIITVSSSQEKSIQLLTGLYGSQWQTEEVLGRYYDIHQVRNFFGERSLTPEQSSLLEMDEKYNKIILSGNERGPVRTHPSGVIPTAERHIARINHKWQRKVALNMGLGKLRTPKEV